MSDLGPSVADIAQARNQKLQHEAEARGQQMQQEVEADTAQDVAAELLSAHLAAKHIKETILPEPVEDTTQTQAFPHGPATSLPSSNTTQQVQQGAADLATKAKDTAAAAGSAIKDTLTPSDQGHTTTSTTSSHGPSITQKVQAGAADLAAKAQGAAAAAGQAIKDTVAPSHATTTSTAASHGPSITQKVQAGAADLYNKAASTAAAAGDAIKHTVAPSSTTTTSTTSSQGPSLAQKVQAGAADLAAKAQGAAAAAGDAIKHTVAPSHTTTTTSTTTSSTSQGPSLTQKAQAAQADLYSKAKNTASAAGEAIKGTIASADQATTTSLRDAAAASREKVGAALSGTADGGVGLAAQAGGLLTQAKEAVKGALGLSPQAEGSPATAYEGAVFSSDDPEYTQQQGSTDASGFPTSPVAVEVGDSTELVPPGQLEPGKPATDQLVGSKTESRTPPLTLSELKGSNLAGAPAGADAATGQATTDSGPISKPRQPVIFSPKEPAGGGSLGEGSVGVSAGDPAGGANIVAAARTAGKGIMASLGFGGTAGAPAGPPGDTPDPRTADVAVGDFKGLKEALAATRDTAAAASSETPAAAGSGSSGSSDAVTMSPEHMDTASNSAGSTDAASSPDPGALKQGYEQMKDSAQQSYEDIKSNAQEKLDAAAQAASEAAGGGAASASGGTAAAGGAGGGLLSGLASLVTDIATKVNLASNSEELMAGGLVPDEAAGPAAAAGATAQQPAPEAAAAADAAADGVAAAKDAAADAMGGTGRSVGEAASDAAAAAKEKASDMAASAQAAVSDAAAAAKDKAADTAAAAKDAVSGAASSAQEKTSDAVAAAKDAASGAASSAQDKAGDAAAAAKGNFGGAANRVQGAGSSLVQGAKEGLVGAYDAAAGAAASAADTIKNTAAQVTGGSSSSSSTQQARAAAGSDSTGDGFGRGSGSSSSPSGGGYAGGEGSSLSQAWEDLKHGGSKAPGAVNNAGETAAPHDVTSNIDRSRHLDDPQQAKIYNAEVYRVSPGSQAHQLPDQEKKRAAAGAVAGAGHQVTGAVPHDVPESSKVRPDQPNRFAADKGIGTGFGTGSAAAWAGDSVKAATAHWVNSSSSAMAGTPAAPEPCPAASSSSSAGGVRGWVSSMVAVWSNIGRAAAVGPTGKDVLKDEQFFENPKQDVMVDPVRGPVKYQGESPGHKVAMRPADQVPTGGSANDPHKVLHKVERLGKAAVDSLTTSSEQAAADPTNLKGKSSDNKPDGTEYFLKHEAAEAVEGLKHTPEKVAGALGAVAEAGSGLVQHIGQKVGEGAQLLAHPGQHTAGSQARRERAEAGVARVAAGGGAPGDGPSEGAPRIHSMNVGAGGAGEMQALEEQRLAAIESPAGRRETLGDKVLGPLVTETGDEGHAKELAASWKEYKAEQQQRGGNDSGPTPGSSPAAMSSSADPSGSKTPPQPAAAAAADATDLSASASGSSASGAAAEEHHAPRHHTHFWQRRHHAAEDIKQEGQHLADEAKGAAQAAKDSSKGLADEAKGAAKAATDSAAAAAGRATGKVQNAAEGLAEGAKDTAREARDTAAATHDSAKTQLQAGVEGAAHGAGRAAGAVADKVEEGKEAAAAAGEAAGNAAGGLLSSVGGAAKSLLGGLLGPFEREAAFEENTAVVAGTPPKPEPVGVEQLSGSEAAGLDEARAAGRGAAERSSRSVGDAVGAKVHQARGAAPPAGDVVDVSRLQAGIDDAAKAAGLAVGHLESSAEAVAHKVAAAQEIVKEQLATAADNIEVPPVEIPSNTEDIIRQRQLQA